MNEETKKAYAEQFDNFYGKRTDPKRPRHIIVDSAPDQGSVEYVDQWVKDGRPYVWQRVEELGQVVISKGESVFHTYEVFVDHSYSWLALFVDGKLTGIAKETIIDREHNVVVLCRDYYSVPKYLWF